MARLVVRARGARGVAARGLRPRAVARAHPRLRRLSRGRRRAPAVARAARPGRRHVRAARHRHQPVPPLRVRGGTAALRASAAARGDLQLPHGRGRDPPRLPHRRRQAARRLQRRRPRAFPPRAAREAPGHRARRDRLPAARHAVPLRRLGLRAQGSRRGDRGAENREPPLVLAHRGRQGPRSGALRRAGGGISG